MSNTLPSLARSSQHAQDYEHEWAKDVWDVRLLPAKFLVHRGTYHIKFTEVPVVFRPAIKRYIKFTVLSGFAHATSLHRLIGSRLFLQYYASTHPDAEDLRLVTRSDIEMFMSHLRATPMRDNKPATQNHVTRTMMALKGFFEYLQRADCPEAPELPVTRLIWPEDHPQLKFQNRKDRSIPPHVLEQLDQSIGRFPDNIRPVVVALRASGWRIQDVLNLRHDRCVERSANGWWLVGDILKTGIMGHRVPISEEIAAVLVYQCDRANRMFTEEENPQKYLFPSPWKGRLGMPLSAENILKELNKVANKCNITDEYGRLYHFVCHAFRHTKGQELINNGMNILHVQQWLAHQSPEMSLVYARIHDTTIYDEWKKAIAKGAVRLSPNGKPIALSPEELLEEDEIEWDYIRHHLDAVRMPHGYCLKSAKMECATQGMPCYTCSYLCTTPDFLQHFLKLKDDALRIIDIGEKQGNSRWVETNRQTLANIEPIIVALESQHTHHPAGKRSREYTIEEREG